MTVHPLVIEPGSEIETADGEIIGRVREWRGAHFRVQPGSLPWRRTYWLPASIVLRTTPGCVALSVPKDAIDAYRVPSPGAGAYEILSAGNRGVFTEAELLQQRQRIEREVTGAHATPRPDVSHGH